MYVKIYTPSGDDFIEVSSTSITFPISSSSESTSKLNFTAASANDTIIIYFTTTSSSSVDVGIASVSIKEKQEYLVPLYAQDIYGNAHKVLRLNAGNTISDD